jgi:hypothetical protein
LTSQSQACSSIHSGQSFTSFQLFNWSVKLSDVFSFVGGASVMTSGHLRHKGPNNARAPDVGHNVTGHGGEAAGHRPHLTNSVGGFDYYSEYKGYGLPDTSNSM